MCLPRTYLGGITFTTQLNLQLALLRYHTNVIGCHGNCLAPFFARKVTHACCMHLYKLILYKYDIYLPHTHTHTHTLCVHVCINMYMCACNVNMCSCVHTGVCTSQNKFMTVKTSVQGNNHACSYASSHSNISLLEIG